MINEEDYLLDKADGLWEKQEEEEKKINEHTAYLDSLSDEEVDYLEEDRLRKLRDRQLQRNFEYKEQNELRLWKDENPREAKIWYARWNYDNHLQYLEQPNKSELEGLKLWLEKRDLFNQEKQTKEWDTWRKHQINDDIITSLNDYLEHIDTDNKFADFNFWKEDHIKEWDSWRTQFIQNKKNERYYEILGWKMHFSSDNNFDFWKSDHLKEWGHWIENYNPKWKIDENVYHFNLGEKEYRIFNELEKLNSDLYDNWLKHKNKSLQICDIDGFNNDIVKYLDQFKNRLLSRVKIMRERRSREEFYNYESTVYSENFEEWNDQYIKQWERLNLKEWENNISSKIEPMLNEYFKNYKQKKSFLANNHLLLPENRDDLENEFNSCLKNWNKYLESSNVLWNKAEKELKNQLQIRSNQTYEMKLFFSWKESNSQKWQEYLEKYVWENYWKPSNQVSFFDWLSLKNDENFFQFWKTSNECIWEKWKNANFTQWKNKIEALELWENWLKEHPNVWSDWADKNLDRWKTARNGEMILQQFEAWQEDHFGSFKEFKKWKDDNSFDWEIWQNELNDRVEKKKWDE